MNELATSSRDDLVPRNVNDLFVHLEDVVSGTLGLQAEVEVEATAGVVGLREAARHHVVAVALVALTRDALLHVAAHRLRAAPRHGRLEGLRHDAQV